MATKKKSKAFVFKGYVNINLRSEHTEDVNKTIADRASVLEAYNRLLWASYSFKFYTKGEEESIKLTVTCFDDKSPNFGHALSSYGQDWYVALAVLCYKHFDIAGEDWTSVSSSINSPFG